MLTLRPNKYLATISNSRINLNRVNMTSGGHPDIKTYELI